VVVGGRARILVVEDEDSYRDALGTALRREGYDVVDAADGREAIRRFQEDGPDLVLLDVLLPGMPGVEVLRELRGMGQVPVIMVSAMSGEHDIVGSLESGATDYVTKPFQFRELLARINAVLRRAVPLTPPGRTAPDRASDPWVPSDGGGPRTSVRQTPDQEPVVVDAGPVHLDAGRRVVTLDGAPVALSRREFDLLALLLHPPGQVRTREECIDEVWAGRDLADTRTLDTHIRRLRLKLEPDPANPRFLLTVRGVGFRFESGDWPGPPA
jgi:two-component system response regulator RegX3